LQAELQQQQQQHRPVSMILGSQSEANVILNPALSSLQRQVGPRKRGMPRVRYLEVLSSALSD
jgi:hypothetical protein